MPNCSFHHIIMSEQALIQKEVLARLSGTGLTVGQPKILEYLSEHDGAGQKEIAGGCRIEPATLTSLLNRMEASGLVERRMLNGNRRNSFVFLTEKGMEKALPVRAAFAEIDEIAFAGFSAKERKVFMDMLLRIYENSLQHSSGHEI